MSTSPLYHGFGLKNHQYLRSEYVKGQIFFTVKQDRWSLRCPVCNGKKLDYMAAVSASGFRFQSAQNRHL